MDIPSISLTGKTTAEVLEEMAAVVGSRVDPRNSDFVVAHQNAFEAALSQRKPKPLQAIFSPDFNNVERCTKNNTLLEELLRDVEIINTPWEPQKLKLPSRDDPYWNPRIVVGPQPYVYVGYANDSRCNASAQVAPDGKYLICFHVGLPLTLYSIFCRMLSHPHILPNVGNAVLEVADGPHAWKVPHKITDYEDVVQARYQASKDADAVEDISLPRCSIRRGFARRLTRCAFLFLVYHELAHLSKGHAKFKRTINQKGVMSNMAFMEDSAEQSLMNWTIDDGFTPFLEQALEYDADAGGTYFSLRLHEIYPYFFDEKFVKTLKLPNLPSFVVHNGDQALDKNPFESWGFAVATAFKLMGFESENLSDLGKFGGHPPAAVRCHLAHATAYSIAELHKIPRSEIRKVMDGIRQANVAFSYVSSEPPNELLKHTATIALSSEIRDYTSKLESQWQESIPSLRPFAWWPLTHDPEYDKRLAEARTNFGVSTTLGEKIVVESTVPVKAAQSRKKSARARRPSRRQ